VVALVFRALVVPFHEVIDSKVFIDVLDGLEGQFLPSANPRNSRHIYVQGRCMKQPPRQQDCK
jgi:hypothetical protein